MRAGTELGIPTVGIFSHEDRFTQHRCVRSWILCSCYRHGHTHTHISMYGWMG